MQEALPEGSEEQAMVNLSLARIMYGTEDFRVPRSVKKAGAIAVPMPVNHLAAWESSTLREFFQKIWQSLTRKA